jgi:hypothetical protein
MADEPQDDELLLENPLTEGGEPDEGGEEAGTEAQQPEGEGDEELEISFGDEAAPASESDTPLIKHLRDQLRNAQKELQEARKAAPSRKIEVGEKPTLAGCEYDEEAFERELEGWHKRRAAAEAEESEAEKAQREADEAWQRSLQSYRDKRSQLKFADVEQVEEVALTALNQVQQAVIVRVADNPALVLYSLGKHPGKLAELSQTTDPLKLAAAIAKLEGTLKVTPKRKAPQPEEIESGNASFSPGADKTLAKLEAEAERTGNRTALIAYRKKLKAEGKL